MTQRPPVTPVAAHDAVEREDLAALAAMLADGLDPETADPYSGATLLQHAVDIEIDGATQTGEALADAMTTLLLAAGASPLTRGCRGETAWDWAHRQRHVLALTAFSAWASARSAAAPHGVQAPPVPPPDADAEDRPPS